MTEEQIALVQKSFGQITPIAETVASLFYGRLFEIDASLRPLFKGDVKVQGRKFMDTIGAVVNSLGRLEDVLPAVEDLGRRHVGYGVEEEHYSSVGDALLWALEQSFGEDEEFTPEVGEAWAAAYGVLADTMKAAAASMDVN